ncbi:hypothetical protein SUNI508_10172 [Seiridium unicorne]|uniref:RING-type domain-containing protein n=1 Tax=Seiridium unicorne TaxID=138068 RepID=A0ABR2UMX4_9PEZI
MRIRKLVTLPVRLPLKFMQRLAPNLRRTRIDGSALTPAETPSEVVSEKARLRNDSPPPPEECPICQDPVGIANPEGTLESWTSLHCGHQFGHLCIQTWLQDSIDRDDPHNPNPTCPICRTVAKHPCCGHPVCIAPNYEMQWNAWQHYQSALEAAFLNYRPPMRQRNRLQRREGHPSRPSFTPPRRMADTPGKCSVCAEASKKKEQEKRIMSLVETDQTHQEHEDANLPTISRKGTLLHLRRRSVRRTTGESSVSMEDEDDRGRSIVCSTPAPRIPTPAPVGNMMVGSRRVSPAY